jgi:hypothetical protein
MAARVPTGMKAGVLDRTVGQRETAAARRAVARADLEPERRRPHRLAYNDCRIGLSLTTFLRWRA